MQHVLTKTQATLLATLAEAALAGKAARGKEITWAVDLVFEGRESVAFCAYMDSSLGDNVALIELLDSYVCVGIQRESISYPPGLYTEVDFEGLIEGQQMELQFTLYRIAPGRWRIQALCELVGTEHIPLSHSFWQEAIIAALLQLFARMCLLLRLLGEPVHPLWGSSGPLPASSLLQSARRSEE